jgi:hypothetical protein
MIILGILGSALIAGFVYSFELMSDNATVTSQASAASDKPAEREALLDVTSG